jgi:PAS domain S-box-containing protein
MKCNVVEPSLPRGPVKVEEGMYRKVLLLDDSTERVERCRRSLADITGVAYQLIHADAVSAGMALIETEHPECLLISWSLPGNGAIAAFYRVHTRHAKLPVIILTEEDTPGYRLEEMKAAGDCDVFPARIAPEGLHSAIQQAIDGSKARQATARSAAVSRSILVIDDSPYDRELCVRQLTRADERYRVIEAGDGDAGLALIDQKRPDCVVLDYSLPGLSGLDVLRRIQAIDAFMPVIMLTGQGDVSIAVQAMKGGAQNYLPKSALTSGLLCQAIVSAIEHAELERLIDQQREQIYQQKLVVAENSRLMTAMLESAPFMILVTDASGKVTVFNKEMERVLGYAASEVVGHHTPTLWAWESPISNRAAALRRHAEPARGAKPAGAPDPDTSPRETVFIRKDGSEVPVSVWVRELYNSDRRIVGFLGLGEDITERKAWLDVLKTSEETFRSAMQHAPCGMALIDLEGRFLKVNRALCQIVGSDEAGLQDTTLPALTHPDDVAIDAEQRRQLLAGEIPSYAVEKRLTHCGGEAVDVELNLSLVRGANDQPQHFVAQFQDIRERKEVDRLKNDFVAVFSHELRTPLTSIRGSLTLLAEANLQSDPATTQGLVRIARRNCERLIALINDILDIETLESRHLHVDMKPAMLNALVREAVEASRGYADSFGVGVATEPLPNDVVVNVDSGRFLQLLFNLISNAVKFSPAGEQVTVAAIPHDGIVRVTVADRGPGIPEEFRTRLFQKFSQADSAANRRAGGSGLGLYISKQLAEHMGGGIGFTTTQGQGSTFWIELPASRADRAALVLAARR